MFDPISTNEAINYEEHILLCVCVCVYGQMQLAYLK